MQRDEFVQMKLLDAEVSLGEIMATLPEAQGKRTDIETPEDSDVQKSKKEILFELSLFFEEDSVLIVERDSGELFDATDTDMHIKGLSGFILSGLLESHKEKTYLVTTGYNRNMIRFSKL